MSTKPADPKILTFAEASKLEKSCGYDSKKLSTGTVYFVFRFLGGSTRLAAMAPDKLTPAETAELSALV